MLRPEAFYELTDGCDVTLADISCRYFISEPPVMQPDSDGDDVIANQGAVCHKCWLKVVVRES